jgi:hypothetical protein
VYQNIFSVYHSLGVSESAAKRAFAGCTHSATPPSKALRKQYYLSFADMPLLDSWTDFGNRTYLFVGAGLTPERLKALILHEIAISIDAKSNILYSTYQMYFSNDPPAKQNEVLKRAFNQATWKPLSMAFAALRAFNVELFSHQQIFKTEHLNCVNSVRKMLERTKTIPSTPRSEGLEDFSEVMAEVMSNKFTPSSEEHEKQILEELLSDQLLVSSERSETVTFCQFMLEPSLTGRSLYNLYGVGPRPRLTGGSGGQGSLVTSQERLLENLNTAKVGQYQTSRNGVQLQQAVEELKRKVPSTANGVAWLLVPEKQR